MITITWDQLSEHDKKGDLKEWLKAERQADKERQLIEDLTCSFAERRADE
ncbi:MAG: hypothetical protein IKE94_06175 [Aeriscardovia sp.]|nr:hypothetical protein [Aeriscardovia sp.]